MIEVLVDTNIVLDALLHRKGFFDAATSVLSRLDGKDRIGCVAATTITNIYYIVCKKSGHAVAEQAVEKTLKNFEIIPVDHDVLYSAWNLHRKDFEDAVQTEAAKTRGIECVITRDKAGFVDSGLTVLSPTEFVERLEKRP